MVTKGRARRSKRFALSARLGSGAKAAASSLASGGHAKGMSYMRSETSISMPGAM